MVQQHAVDVREARAEDVGAVRRIARSSLESSYLGVLEAEGIGVAVERWYARDRFEEKLGHEPTQILVGQRGSELAGFSEAELEADGSVGAINWLHVDPHHRNEGIGSTLLEHTEEALAESGAERLEGRVLKENEVGNEFYRSHGYTLSGNRVIEIAGESVLENRYLTFPDRATVQGLLEPVETERGTFYVALDERERGTKGPFYAVFRDEDRDCRYGYYCANCRSLETAMDPMGAIECCECENTRKGSRWDAAYL
ncbi:MAG: GNAT family N-acetyltransferase [Halodesulfurarchaeum sp.]